MTQPERPQGNFTINLNYRRTNNRNAPPITGRVSTPEAPDTEYSFSLFQHTDEKGRPYWIGPVDVNTSVRRALYAPPSYVNHFIAMRENGFKIFAEMFDEQGNAQPNPDYEALSAERKAEEDAKPAFWGSWTRTESDPVLKLAAWERTPSRYGPWASGNTQHPLTKEQLAALGQTPDQAQADLLTQPEPARKPRRAARTDEARDHA